MSGLFGFDAPEFKVRAAPILLGIALLVPSWVLMWTRTTFWNPVFFWGTWTGGTLVVYGLGRPAYPGLRRHVLLSAVSVPLWWWYELVNERVGNWEYVSAYDYSRLEYFLFASLAFSTVAPAIDAAARLTKREPWGSIGPDGAFGRRGYLLVMALGLAAVTLNLGFPKLFFSLTWVGPFLVIDGIVGYQRGRSLVSDLWQGEWRLPVAIASAGMMCGFFWEFWNFWASPKWVYEVPLFDFLYVFEMPLLGYGGYVPFAWSVYQLFRVRPVETLVSPRLN